MIAAVNLPPGGATLSFDTNQDTEQDFDFANVDVSADGVNFTTVASFSGTFVGTRFINISGFAGGPIRVRFRMTSDLAVPAPGWYVENIRISSDDFRTIADLPPTATSLPITARTDGTYTYRVAGLFANGTEPPVTGPYSNLQCVVVNQPLDLSDAVSRKLHNGVAYDVALPATSRSASNLARRSDAIIRSSSGSRCGEFHRLHSNRDIRDRRHWYCQQHLCEW
jgi:hypothetical protein